MGKNIRRGRTSNVRCASCGQITRRDRAVYLFRDGIKAYYCPDCAKKIRGQRLYKGMPKYVKKTTSKRVKRKFTIFATEDSVGTEMPPDNTVENEINLSEEKEDQDEQENNEQ
jgi:NAD-dependent SIR2 family protein deacetylase